MTAYSSLRDSGTTLTPTSSYRYDLLCITQVGRVCNFLGSVSRQQKFEKTDGSVLQLSFIWQAKENTFSRNEGRPTKGRKEKRNQRLNSGSSFYTFFLLPLSLPYVNCVSQEGCLLHLKFSLQSSNLPLFYFRRRFPFFVFQPPLQTLFSYSSYLAFPPQKIRDPVLWEYRHRGLSGYFLLNWDSKRHWASLLLVSNFRVLTTVHLRVGQSFTYPC